MLLTEVGRACPHRAGWGEPQAPSASCVTGPGLPPEPKSARQQSNSFLPRGVNSDAIAAHSEADEYRPTLPPKDCLYDNTAGMGVGKDKEYFEDYQGRLIDGKGEVGRYVRLYSQGSTYIALNRYTEVEVFGRLAK